MNDNTVRRGRRAGRGRLVAGLLATSAMAVSGLAATGGPAQSADPAGDCTAAYPLANVAADQTVHGLTVEKGVSPDPFTGKVLGVLDNGLTQLSVDSYLRQILVGVIIVVAVAGSSLSKTAPR